MNNFAMPMDALRALLRLHELASGADFCDRCGGTIWPEIELVRCDFCVGKYGAPTFDLVREAERRHSPRIRAYEREREEEEIRRLEETG